MVREFESVIESYAFNSQNFYPFLKCFFYRNRFFVRKFFRYFPSRFFSIITNKTSFVPWGSTIKSASQLPNSNNFDIFSGLTSINFLCLIHQLLFGFTFLLLLQFLREYKCSNKSYPNLEFTYLYTVGVLIFRFLCSLFRLQETISGLQSSLIFLRIYFSSSS